MIIVLDTSVWVSGLEFGGVPLQALDLITGQFQIAVCDSILAEVHHTLAQKFGWPQKNIDEALAHYAREIILIQVTGTIKGVCRDPNDDMVLECAVLANADLLVSGDKDLLTIGNYEDILILTPREFLSLHGVGNTS